MDNGKTHPVVVASIGVVSVILGAVLAHFLSAQEKRVSLLDDARRQAYLDFLEGQEQFEALKSARMEEEKARDKANEAEKNGDEKAAKIALADVKEMHKRNVAMSAWNTKFQIAINKIAIYGDSGVVRALASHYRQQYPSKPCTKEWSADVKIYQDMRRSLIPKEEATDKDLAELVLLCAAPDSEQGSK